MIIMIKYSKCDETGIIESDKRTSRLISQAVVEFSYGLQTQDYFQERKTKKAFLAFK